jgi:polysaccharide export outer membrane protein
MAGTTAFVRVLSLLLVMGTAAQAEQPPAAQGSYRIGPGDVLDVIVWRNRELTMQVTVRPDGWISMPLAGEVHVAGATAAELQRRLEALLDEIVTSPAVTVVVTRVAPLKVSILGKVRQPGRYAVEAPATVLDVLALAGGPTEYANPDAMYVLRRAESPEGEYQQIPVSYSSSVNGGKILGNVPVRPGDIIVVP